MHWFFDVLKNSIIIILEEDKKKKEELAMRQKFSKSILAFNRKEGKSETVLASNELGDAELTDMPSENQDN
ncbi:MAG: hypothetical protein F9K43_05465 [Bauldia sp.]|nr:MAG: hypothetical protein F9K43_05465 [Bauldia sp.]